MTAAVPLADRRYSDPARLPSAPGIDKAAPGPQGTDVRIAIAYLAGLVAFPVASWLARMAVTVATLPLAGVVRDSQSRAALRALRVGSGIVCGAAGFLAAARVSAWLGASATVWLACLLGAYLVFAHVPGLRRLAGGPQVGDESLSFAGEELGLVAGALVWFSR